MDQAGTGLSAERVEEITNQINFLKNLIDDPSIPEDMTGGDYDFIENIAISHEELKVLSPKQIKNIERLYEKFHVSWP